MFYEIIATDTTGGGSAFFGESWASAASTSFEWKSLLAGHSYSFSIRSVNQAAEHSVAATTTVTIPAAGCSGIGDLCVTVDATDLGAENRFVGAGLLHGLASDTDPDYATFVEPLNVQQWRANGGPNVNAMGATFDYIDENAMDVSTTVMVGPLWLQANQKRNYCGPLFEFLPRTPWDNFTFYRTWLTNLVNTEIGAGREPTYWDALNETGLKGPFFTTDGTGHALTDALCPNRLDGSKLLDYLWTTADVLHGLGQKVLASAWTGWNEETAYGVTDPFEPLATFDPGVSLEQILDYSDLANLRWDGFSYHELNGAYGSFPQTNWRGTPRAYITNASQARALIANHPLQNGVGLFINEYFGGDGPGGYTPPGKVAGHLFGITVTDPVEANRSCYSGAPPVPSPGNYGYDDCTNGSLAGLLHIDSLGVPHKRGAWYVQEAYARMTGNLVETTTNEATLTSLATFDDDTDEVRVMVGRHDNASVRADADTKVMVKTPVAFGSTVTVTFEEILDSGTGAAPAPTVWSCDVTVGGGGFAQIDLDDYEDNAAYLLTIEPDTGSHPAC